VGTGVGTAARVREALVAALTSAGAPPRAFAAEPLKVTAYAPATALAGAARTLHRELFGA